MLTTDGPTRAPYALAASADAHWLATLDSPIRAASESGDNLAFQSVTLWNLPATTSVRRLTGVDLGFDVDLSPDGGLVAITGDGGRVLRTSDGQTVWEFPPPPDVPSSGSWVRNFAFSPDGKLLASGRSYTVDLFRADTGAPVDKLVAKKTSPGVAFSPDGLYLASSEPSLWRVSDRAGFWSPADTDRFAVSDSFLTDNSAVFSPDGKLLLTQTAVFRQAGRVWSTTTGLVDATTGSRLRSFSADLSRRPTFSPDGLWILAGDRLIDVKTGRESALGFPAAASLFLFDGRIAAADASGAVSLLCPSPS